MTKKIVIINGSPRKGNTVAMLESFKEALSLENAPEIVQYDAALKKNDAADFEALDKDLKEADALLLAAPVYWYTFPAKIKEVIDHFFSFYLKGNTFEGKKCALFAVCEEESLETFKGLEFSFDKSIIYMKGENIGKVLVPGVFEADDIKKTDGEARAAEFAKNFK